MPSLKLANSFFARDAQAVAKELLGKVLCVKQEGIWLRAIIIETEAYYIHDKASHASLGFTLKRKALFMPPGTIYMYHSRGGDSLNISCLGDGNAVLIKSAYPYVQGRNSKKMLEVMQKLNPAKNSLLPRFHTKLCCGQALLCKSLGLKISKWDQQQFRRDAFFIADYGYTPEKIIQTMRLGITKGRDEHLPYRFIDAQYLRFCTKFALNLRECQTKVRRGN